MQKYMLEMVNGVKYEILVLGEYWDVENGKFVNQGFQFFESLFDDEVVFDWVVY